MHAARDWNSSNRRERALAAQFSLPHSQCALLIGNRPVGDDPPFGVDCDDGAVLDEDIGLGRAVSVRSAGDHSEALCRERIRSSEGASRSSSFV